MYISIRWTGTYRYKSKYRPTWKKKIIHKFYIIIYINSGQKMTGISRTTWPFKKCKQTWTVWWTTGVGSFTYDAAHVVPDRDIIGHRLLPSVLIVEVVGQPEKEGVVHKLQAGIGQSILKNRGSINTNNPTEDTLHCLYIIFICKLLIL